MVMILLCAPTMTMAQRGNFPTRQQLDSLVNPALSTKATGALRASDRDKNIGIIGAGELARVSFVLHNATAKPITITELRSSCGCLTVTTKPSTIEPHSAMTVDAVFNPAGRNGWFSQNILVYTHLDGSQPTERLIVEGTVINDDEWLHLPKHMGVLRLSRKEVTITTKGEERIAVANTSAQPLGLSAKTTIKGLTFRTEPEIIEAGKEGDIIIEYDGEPCNITTMLIVEGIAARPSERVIKITIKR